MVSNTSPARYFIMGGARFVGNHLIDRLIKIGKVAVYGSLSSGRRDFMQHRGRKSFQLIEADLFDFDTLNQAIAGYNVVFQLAANPEARQGAQDTRMDLEELL